MIISIIIPVFKTGKYIEACLESCLEQDIEDSEYELILVDDGSPDKSIEIAKKILGERRNVTIISQKNAGLSAARNKGLSIAKGEYIWFVDSDDRIEPNCLGYLKFLCENYDPDIVSFCAADVLEESVRRRFSRQEGVCHQGRDYIINGRLQVCSPFSLFKKKFLDSKGLKFVNGIFHEDSEFTPRAYYLADKVIESNHILYYVTQNPDSITRSANPRKASDSICVVQANISRLSAEADKHCRKGFNNLIASDFNHALKNSYQMDAARKKELDKLAYDNRYLLKHLLGATRFKFIIAGLVYSLFPKHMVECYQIMHKFKDWD